MIESTMDTLQCIIIVYSFYSCCLQFCRKNKQKQTTPSHSLFSSSLNFDSLTWWSPWIYYTQVCGWHSYMHSFMISCTCVVQFFIFTTKFAWFLETRDSCSILHQVLVKRKGVGVWMNKRCIHPSSSQVFDIYIPLSCAWLDLFDMTTP